MGARAYSVISRFDFRPGECVVEIGSERGEGSTSWIASFCDRQRVEFHTVDLDKNAYARARSICRRKQSGVCHAHRMRGERFIADQRNLRIRFAYLDSFDCIPHGLEDEPFIEFYRAKYETLGLVMTNQNSQSVHLLQAALVEMRSAKRCAVLIDDTSRDDGVWDGKGALAIPYLQSCGFEVHDLGDAQLAERA